MCLYSQTIPQLARKIRAKNCPGLVRGRRPSQPSAATTAARAA